MARGTLLAHQAGAHQDLRLPLQEETEQVSTPALAPEATLVSEAVVDTVGVGAGVVVASGGAGVGVGAGAVGASASDGRSGALTGGRTPGVRGTPTTDTTHTGTLRTRPTTTIRTTVTTGPPIRRPTGRRMTTTSQPTIQTRLAQRMSRYLAHRSRSWKKSNNSRDKIIGSSFSVYPCGLCGKDFL